MQKNVAGQKWTVFAFNRTNNVPLTGDAANITANLRIDGGAANAVDDVNPTELEDGFYIFDITQAESNGENIVIAPVSSTGDIQVIGVPGAVYTTPANFPDLSVAASTGRTSADMVSVSGDTVAADNLESQYDTTGLTGDTFPATQQQLSNIALTGATVSTPAKDAPNGFVITSGENEANDEDSTHALDDVTHDIEAINDTGTEKIEVYYEFSIGGDGIPTGVSAHHQFDKGGGSAKNLTVWAYNWGGATWDQIGTLNSGTSLETDTYTLFTSHVGTGANIGLVRIRYLTGSVSLTATSKLIVDQIFLEYAIVTRTVGYADGAIWINTNASNTNTESHVDGVADNPVSTWAAALTLSGQLGITRFRIINGSAITLTGNSDNYSILGQEYTLAFGGQSTAALYVFGGSVSGIGTGAVLLEDCPVGNVSLPPSIMRRCFVFGTITNTGTGDWFINDPRSRVAGAASPVFDFGTAVGNTNLNIRGNSGGWQLEAMGNTGTDMASIEGWGQIIEGTCTGGTVVTRGHFTLSGITNLTISDDARFTRSELVADVWDRVISMANHNIGQSAGKVLRQSGDLIQIAGAVSDASPTTTDFDTDLTQVDTYFADSIMIFTNGAANAGLGKAVSTYVNASGHVTFEAAMAWPVTPVNGDDFVLIALHSHPIAEIQSGLATEAKQDVIDGIVDDILIDTTAIKAKTDNLPDGIKKNTALANFPFFMVDDTDKVTGKTGLTITAQRSIDGAAFANCANSAAELSNGVYVIDLAASDLNGDTIIFKFTGTDALARLITVIPQT